MTDNPHPLDDVDDDADLAAWLADRDPTVSSEPFDWNATSTPKERTTIDEKWPQRSYPMGGQGCLLVHPQPFVVKKIASIPDRGAIRQHPIEAASRPVRGAIAVAALHLDQALPSSVAGKSMRDAITEVVATGWGITAFLIDRPLLIQIVDDSTESMSDTPRTLLSRTRSYGMEAVLGEFGRKGMSGWVAAIREQSPVLEMLTGAGIDPAPADVLLRQAFFTGLALGWAEFEIFTTPPGKSPDVFNAVPDHHHRFDYLKPYTVVEQAGRPVVAFHCTRPDCSIIDTWPAGPAHDHRYDTAGAPILHHPDGRPVWRCVEDGCSSYTWG